MSIAHGRVRPGRPIDDEKFHAILDAAAAAFFDNGYAASTIEGIAAEAGVSKVTVYNRFGGKAGLFTAAVERECQSVRNLVDFEKTDGSIRDRLTAFGHGMRTFLSQDKIIAFEHRIAAETERLPEVGRMFLEAGPKKMLAALASLFRAADEAGELKIADPDIAAEQFAGMVKGIAHMERRFGVQIGEAQSARRIDAAVDLIMSGYGVAQR